MCVWNRIAAAATSLLCTMIIGLTLNHYGVTWDEGPYYQSKRLEIYRKYIDQLLENGQEYYCYCNPEDLDREKKAAYKRKEDWQYDRRCLNLSEKERAEKESKKIPKVVRFLVPDGPVAYHDLIHKEITREAKDIEDLVIMRSNGVPTYNLVCVVDDYEMGISHVIRAVDHITNTPKQILLFRALGFPLPEYAHLPLILGKDKSKLSKRHGAVSLMDYAKRGYLAEAMFNYLALLGWSPGDDREIMNHKEIIESFDISRINPSNAVFDEQKLEWVNGQYLYGMDDDVLLEHVRPFLLQFKLMKEAELEEKKEWLMKVCGLVKLRLKTLTNINDVGRYFFVDDFEYEADGLAKHFNADTIDVIQDFLPKLEAIQEFKAQSVEESVREHAAANNLKARQIIHPLRFYITGKQGGPGLFETMELVGKERCAGRLRRWINDFKKQKEGQQEGQKKEEEDHS